MRPKRECWYLWILWSLVAFPICGCKEKHCDQRLCVRSFPSLPKWFALCYLVSVTDIVDSVLMPPDLVKVHKSWGEGCHPIWVSTDGCFILWPGTSKRKWSVKVLGENWEKWFAHSGKSYKCWIVFPLKMLSTFWNKDMSTWWERGITGPT